MATLAQTIQLFNAAYTLAWEHVTKHPRMKKSDTAVSLSNSIRLQIKGGQNDAEAIALEAIKSLAK